MKHTPVTVVLTVACPGYGLSNNRIIGSPDNQISVDISQNKGGEKIWNDGTGTLSALFPERGYPCDHGAK